MQGLSGIGPKFIWSHVNGALMVENINSSSVLEIQGNKSISDLRILSE